MQEDNKRLIARVRNCVDTIIEIRPSLVKIWGIEIFSSEFEQLEEIKENFDECFGNFSEEDVDSIERWVQIFFAEIEEGFYKIGLLRRKEELM